jgi:hypothetical protein
MSETTTVDRATEPVTTSLLERLALVRLNRFARVAAAAEGSASPIWQGLARTAARSAYRDCLLLGLSRQAQEIVDRQPEHARAA